jgi:hypothetical protein
VDSSKKIMAMTVHELRLISRQWSGKTLVDHKADRRDWVTALLGVTTASEGNQDDADQPAAGRHAWEMARPDDSDVMPLGHRLLRAVSERIRWRGELVQARARVEVSAIPSPDEPREERHDRTDT